MDKRFFYLILLTTVNSISSIEQQNPVYNHYFDNTFLLNPSEVASSGFMNVTANQRMQWFGIEGAPMVSTLTFQTPFDYKKYALGGHIRSFKRGAITTNDLLATYGYTI